MHTAALITRPDAPDASALRSDRSAASPQRTPRQPAGELNPLLGFIPVAGPPAVLLVGPLVLSGLLLVGPFVVILTLAVLLASATALVALAGWIVASPYLLVRHLRARRTAAPATISRPAPSLIPASSRRVAA